MTDILVILHYETEEAILVSEIEDSEQVWLPLSLVEITDVMEDDVIEIEIPEWLAEEKELI